MKMESSSLWNNSRKSILAHLACCLATRNFGWDHYLEETKFLIVIWVSPVTLFANIARVLVKKVIILTTDKALCIVCNEGGSIPNVSKFWISTSIIQILSSFC